MRSARRTVPIVPGVLRYASRTWRMYSSWPQPSSFIHAHPPQPCGGGAGAPAFSDNFEVPGEQLQTIESETAIVHGIFVEGVTEGRHQVQVAAGGEHAAEFAANADGVAHVFQD